MRGFKMLNLSQQVLDSPDVSPLEKFKFLWLPEFYLAEDVKDLRNSMYKLKCPLYKKIISRKVGYGEERTAETAFIVIYNVGIKAIQDSARRIAHLGHGCREFVVPPSFFSISDQRETVLAYWNTVFPACLSFSEAQEREGLKERDFVHMIVFRFSIKRLQLHIFDLTKTEFSRPAIDSEPALSRARSFLPRLIPVPVPGPA